MTLEPASAGIPVTAVTATPQPKTRAPQGHHRLTPRRTVEVCVLMTLGILLLRTFMAEAYIVPTSSMASALVGYHKSITCPKCGFPVTVGHLGRVSPDGRPEDLAQARRHYALASCPNCGWDQLDLAKAQECAGDRLLVHKHVFDLRPPHRWELAVFRHPPSDAPASGQSGPYPPGSDAYIKRVVGLPGETVQVRDGDVYLNGSIARKRLRELKEMLVLVYDDGHVPSDAFLEFRWSQRFVEGWRVCAPDPKSSYGSILTSGPNRPDSSKWLSYRHLTRHSETGNRQVWRQEELKDRIGNNGAQGAERLVHDVFLEADLEVSGDGWLDLAITDGHDDVLIHIPVGSQDGKSELRYASSENWSTNAGGMNTRIAALRAQARVPTPTPIRLAGEELVHLQFGLVDRRLFLVLGEMEIFEGGYDLPVPPAERARRSMSRPLVIDGQGPVSFGLRDATLRARNLKLYRDVHYTDGDGRDLYPNGVNRPVTLGAGEFFVLGDNSANSYDSRCWPAGTAVRHDWLVGKPFLLHLPTQIVEWQLWGEKRALAVPDWERMKLLR